MPEGENLYLDLETRPNGGPEGSEQSDEQRSHAGWERYQRPTQICNGDSMFRISGRDRFRCVRGFPLHRLPLAR